MDFSFCKEDLLNAELLYFIFTWINNYLAAIAWYLSSSGNKTRHFQMILYNFVPMKYRYYTIRFPK